MESGNFNLGFTERRRRLGVSVSGGCVIRTPTKITADFVTGGARRWWVVCVCVCFLESKDVVCCWPRCCYGSQKFWCIFSSLDCSYDKFLKGLFQITNRPRLLEID
jgi:hypothetical protein